MAKKKFYVVWDGWETGIFDNWTDCKKSISNYKSAKYKSFKTLAVATKAFSESYFDYAGKDVFETVLTAKELKLIGRPDMKTISVDAACSGNPGPMEYQGVDTRTKSVLFRVGPLANGTNNIGEFLALVHGLAVLKNSNDTRPIYSDSKIAMNWVKYKKIRTLLKQDHTNKKIFELIDRAIKWLNENEYETKIIKWETKAWGEIPADFGRK